MTRKRTQKIYLDAVAVGGGSPITVQSMTNTDTRDVRRTLRQIRRLEKAGCDIVRVAVPDAAAVAVLPEIVAGTNIPVVADIHFDYRLAVKSIDAGVSCIRINPGNIGNRHRLEKVVYRAAAAGIAIRVGINAGSLEKGILKKHGHPSAAALVESALKNVRAIEEMGFKDLKVSIKSSNVMTSVDAYRGIAKMIHYPLHVGITEAGTDFSGTVKSAVGLGILLNEGIGDTLRVSLSADPVREVHAGFEILRSLNLRRKGPELISCPTCGRKQVDVIGISKIVERKITRFKSDFKVAVMGCEVNGPGEAKEADIGLAGSRKYGVIFKKGKIIKKVPQDRMLSDFLDEIEKIEMETAKS